MPFLRFLPAAKAPVKPLFLLVLALSVMLAGCNQDKAFSTLHPELQKAAHLYQSADFQAALTSCLTLRDSLTAPSSRLAYQVQLCLARNQAALTRIDQAMNSLAVADSLRRAAPENFARRDTLFLEFAFRQAQAQAMLGEEKTAGAQLEGLPLKRFPNCMAKATIYDWLASSASQQLDSDKALALLGKAEDTWAAISEENPAFSFRIPLGRADFFFHTDLPEKAIEQLEEAEAQLKAQHPGNAIIEAKIAYLKGLCYQFDPRAAINHFLEAASLLETSQGEGHPELLKVYDAIANSYRWAGDCNQALAFYDNALQVKAPPLPLIRKEKALIQHNMGVLFMDCGAYQRAKTSYDKSIKQLEQDKNKYIGLDKFLVTAKTNRATLDYYYGGYASAIEFFQLAIEEAENTIGTQNSYIAQPYINMAACHMALGEQALKNKDKQLAAEHYRNGVQAADKGLEALNFDTSRPDPFASAYSPKSLQYGLWNRAESYLGLYRATGNPQWLHEADRDYRLSVDFLGLIRQGFWEEMSILGFAAANKIVYERAIETNFELYQKFDKKKSHLAYCFEMMEKGKGLLLLDIVRKNGIEPNQLFSPALFTRETELTREIRRLESRRTRKQGVAENGTGKLEKELFARKKEYQSVLAEIKDKHPKYYGHKFGTKTMALPEAQSMAREEEATIITYFLGDHSHYAMVINPEDFSIIPIDTSTELTNAIRNFPVSLSEAWQGKGGSKAKIQAADHIARQGHFLYRQLVEPLSPLFSSNRLIILPDDILGYLPFEALPQKEVQNPQAYHQYHFLLKDYQVSYAQSASLLGQMRKKKGKAPSNPWLGISPSYVDADGQDSLLALLRTGLLPLQYNQPSVKALQAKTGGDALLGEKATKSRFLQLAPEYRVLHFSMHAGVDDAMEKAGFLAFHNGSKNVSEYLLYFREIYPLELYADMVVLSACETNLGELHYSEGIINLTRAFSYAGTKSVFATLWKVDDRASMELMQAFYGHLQDKPKDEALRLAKLSLMDNPNYTAPFYWAAFKPIGDMSRISWD